MDGVLPAQQRDLREEADARPGKKRHGHQQRVRVLAFLAALGLADHTLSRSSAA